MKLAIVIALLASTASAARAAPQPGTGLSPPVMRDLRCLILSAALAADDDPDKSKGGQIGMAYFGGKLAVETPNLDLPSTVRTVVDKEGNAGLNAARERCANEMQALDDRLNKTGASLNQNPAGK
jgi:hypothetical protein